MRRAWARAGLAVAVVAVGLTAVRDRPARFLAVEDPPRPCDAVVVMAGDPGYERTRTAVALLRESPAGILLLTGGETGPGDSAASLRERALALGVPPARVRMETVSHSTRQAVLAAAPILAAIGARTVAVVTSPYHQRRASAAARRAWPGVVVVSRPASPSHWQPEGWWRTGTGWRVVVTEYVKLAYYGVRGWL